MTTPEREAVQRIIDRIPPTLGQVWIGREYAVNDLLTDLTCLINDDQSSITDSDTDPGVLTIG